MLQMPHNFFSQVRRTTMRAYSSLLLLNCLLALPMCILSPRLRDTQTQQRTYLEGAWVLYSVDIDGVVTPQLPDEIDLRRRSLERLPELRDLPVDPLEGASVTTFTGSEYVTRQYGDVVAHGNFRVDFRASPPVMES